MYGAVGDNVTDDTAAVQAAINAAQNGGIFYIPPKTYRCTGPLTYYINQIWMGTGTASCLRCSQDLWAGGTTFAARFITPSTPNSFQNQARCCMSNFRINGPSASTLGQTTNKTIGLRTQSQLIMDNLSIQNFYAGIEEIQNFTVYNRIWIANCYYSISFSDATLNRGYTTFRDLIIINSGLAAIHTSGNGGIQNANFTQTYIINTPVGILRTDWQNTTTPWDANGNPMYAGGQQANQNGIVATSFRDINMLGMGNGAIIDATAPSPPAVVTMGWNTSFRPLGMGWNAAFRTTNAPLDNADYQGAWAINISQSDMISAIEFNISATPPAGTLGVCKVRTTLGPTIFTNTLPTNFLGSGTSWTNASQGRQKIELANTGSVGGPVGECYVMATLNQTVNVGDIVEIGAAPGIIQRATGTRPIYGVAMTPVVAGGAGIYAAIVVMIRGAVMANSASATLPFGSRLYCNTATPYLVDTTSTTNPMVGMSTNNGTATQVATNLRPN